MLTGPYTSISTYGCFAIKIDIPGPYTSTGNAGGSIKWEWDCYDSKYAEEVDKGPVTRTISSSGPGRNVEVIYAVMSNALKAIVQVKRGSKMGTALVASTVISPHALVTSNSRATTGYSRFAECQRHSAKAQKHSANSLPMPSVTLH